MKNFLVILDTIEGDYPLIMKANDTNNLISILKEALGDFWIVKHIVEVNA